MSELMLDGGRGIDFPEDGRKGDWMQGFSGKRYYPLDPRPGDFNIIDIAHALGQISRYTGHCLFYSVAEHSVLVSHMVPEADQLAGLFHDATEMLLADLSRPVKRNMSKDNEYFVMESRVYAAMAEQFGLPAKLPETVKFADLAICHVEKEWLHPRSDPWDLPEPKPRGIVIECLPPQIAPWTFLRRYCNLTDENFAPLADEYNGWLHDNKKRLRARFMESV